MIENLFNIIKALEMASGLRINLKKSSVSGINVSDHRASQVALKWGCLNQSLNISYLENPLGGKPSTESFWNQVVENIQKKLDGWRFSYLSKGGRQVLI